MATQPCPRTTQVKIDRVATGKSGIGITNDRQAATAAADMSQRETPVVEPYEMSWEHAAERGVESNPEPAWGDWWAVQGSNL